MKKGFYYKFLKRPFDLIVALLAFIILIPVYLFIALLVRIKMGKPILFKQKRPGKDEKIFTLLKFRTMKDMYDENGQFLPDGIRLTRFGKFLRSTSLDELPSLINVIRGDMSFVGPRPLLIEYLPLYSADQKKRHLVRPGITGLSQVNGRNSIDWNTKFTLDVQYINSITLINDFKILIRTLFKVFKREGISSATSETMEPFRGTANETVNG